MQPFPNFFSCFKWILKYHNIFGQEISEIFFSLELIFYWWSRNFDSDGNRIIIPGKVSASEDWSSPRRLFFLLQALCLQTLEMRRYHKHQNHEGKQQDKPTKTFLHLANLSPFCCCCCCCCCRYLLLLLLLQLLLLLLLLLFSLVTAIESKNAGSAFQPSLLLFLFFSLEPTLHLKSSRLFRWETQHLKHNIHELIFKGIK